MYIRTAEEALAALAEILDLPQRRDQLVQSTLKIMLCLEAEPRSFLVDCQSLLVEGGLEALQEKRRTFLQSMDDIPVVILDPEEDRRFEAVARTRDALRFAGLVIQVFPEFGSSFGRWWIARALLAREDEIRRLLTHAIRARRYAEEFDPLRRELGALLHHHRPRWIHRIEELRRHCREALRGVSSIREDLLEKEAEEIFEVLAAGEEDVPEILDPPEPAVREARIRHLHELVGAVRSVESEAPRDREGKDLNQVA